MCCNHIKSEPRSQTFTFHTLPRPLCEVDYVKLQSHWSSNEPEKELLSVDIVVFLVCVRKFMCSLTFLFKHICLNMTWTHWILGNMRITTFLPMQLMKCVHIPEARWCLERPRRRFHVTRKNMNLTSQTRKSAK